MTGTTENSRTSPILALARDLRHAERARAENLAKPIKVYNGAIHQRLDHAGDFLRALQKADAEYEVDSQRALDAYRETIDKD
jgi:hypothetical protein